MNDSHVHSEWRVDPRCDDSLGRRRVEARRRRVEERRHSRGIDLHLMPDRRVATKPSNAVEHSEGTTTSFSQSKDALT